MGKTGTTALQNFFWNNREKLKHHDVLYPEIGVVAGAHHLLSPHHPRFLKSSFDFLSVEEWIPFLAICEQNNILISSELISWSSADVVSEFCNTLNKHFDVRVVIYIRRQDNIIMAGYNQQIKAGTQKKQLTQILEGQIKRFDYEKIIEPWKTSLGHDCVIVRPYERVQFYKSDLVKDFIHNVFGFEVEDGYLFETKNNNPRLSISAMEYKRFINNIFPDTVTSSQYNEVLLKYSKNDDGSSSQIYSDTGILSPSDRRKIVERYSEANARIFKEYLSSEDGVLFLEPLPEPNNLWVSGCPITTDKVSDISEYMLKHTPLLYEQLMAGLRRWVELNGDNHELMHEMQMNTFIRVMTKSWRRSDLRAGGSDVHRRRLILHIGMHKTGTTSIQNELSKSRDILEKHKVHYPVFRQANHSLNFGPLFVDNPNISELFKNAGVYGEKAIEAEKNRLQEMWIKEFERFDGKDFIISGEQLSLLSHDGVRRLRAFVAPYFDDVKIIVYVREPLSFLRSAMQQRIKGGKRYSHLPKLYKSRIIHYVQEFGDENVIVRPFLSEAFAGGDLFTDFFASLGIDVDLGLSFEDKSNEALGINSLRMLTEYNKRYPYLVDDKINEKRGLVSNRGYFFSILRRVCDDKYDLDFEVTEQMAKELNEEVRYVNNYLPAEFKFNEVQPRKGSGAGLESDNIPLEYFIDLINEYNMEIDRLLKRDS
jgi:hypothetical protein